MPIERTSEVSQLLTSIASTTITEDINNQDADSRVIDVRFESRRGGGKVEIWRAEEREGEQEEHG